MKPLLLVVALAAACSDSSSPEPMTTPDAAVAIDAPGPCPPATLCLSPFLVEPEKPVAPARIAVVWFQPMHVNGLPPMPIEIGYDAPFTPNLPRYEIPLAQVKAPISDQVLLCQWENGVCLRDARPPAVGFGLALVLQDANANGRVDVSEVSFYSNQGGGMAYLAWSKLAHAVGSPALAYDEDTLTYLGEIFTKGIAAGVQSYELIPRGFDNALGAPDTGDGADLALCPGSGASCQVGMPRVLDADNP